MNRRFFKKLTCLAVIYFFVVACTRTETATARSQKTGLAFVIESIVLMFTVTGCGKSGTSSSSTGSIGSIANLAPITSGVSSVATQSLDFTEMDGPTPGSGQPKQGAGGPPKGGSQSGSGLGNTSWSGKSGEMCQTENMVAQSYGEAGQADMIMCFMAAMVKDGLIPTTDNVYDGNMHYYTFAGGGDDGGHGQGGGGGGGSNGKFLIEVTATKDSSGNITNFALGHCQGGTTLNGYVSYAISNGTTTAVSYSTHSQGSMTSSELTTAIGKQDGQGGWLSKDLVTDAQFGNSGGGSGPAFSQSMHMDFQQFANYGTMLGYFSGTFTPPSGSAQTNTGAMAAAFQLIGSTSLSTFSVGDGTFTGKFSNSGFNQSGSVTVSWSGDTGANVSPASSGAYYSIEQQMTVPTPAAITVTAPAGASWNCQPPSGSFTTLNLENASFKTDMAACRKQFGFTNGGWQSCSGTSY